MSTRPDIQAFLDEATNTVSYLVADVATGRAAVIDPVLDFEPRSGRLSTRSADHILETAAQRGLRIDWILETHAHADHLSAAAYLRSKTGGQVGIGEHIREVQKIFGPAFNLDDVSGDGREFDRLFRDGDVLAIGQFQVTVLHTPGHTPACVSYCIDDTVFVGDTLFMPDYGTARADFPGGDARTLYRSIRKLLDLPADTVLMMCHDYAPPGRTSPAWQTTVAEQRAHNVHVHDGVTESEFAAFRAARDATLPPPTLLLPSIQVNIRAGKLPPPEHNGTRYLKTPLRLDRELEGLTEAGLKSRAS